MSGKTTEQKVADLINEVRRDSELKSDQKVAAFESLLGQIALALEEVVDNQASFGEVLVRGLESGLSKAMAKLSIKVEPKIDVAAPSVKVDVAAPSVKVDVAAPAVTLNPKFDVAAPSVTVEPKFSVSVPEIKVPEATVTVSGAPVGAVWEGSLEAGVGRSMKITLMRVK